MHLPITLIHTMCTVWNVETSSPNTSSCAHTWGFFMDWNCRWLEERDTRQTMTWRLMRSGYYALVNRHFIIMGHFATIAVSILLFYHYYSKLNSSLSCKNWFHLNRCIWTLFFPRIFWSRMLCSFRTFFVFCFFLKNSVNMHLSFASFDLYHVASDRPLTSWYIQVAWIFFCWTTGWQLEPQFSRARNRSWCHLGPRPPAN